MPPLATMFAPVLRWRSVTSRLREHYARLTTDEHARNAFLALADQAIVSGTNFATSILVGWCGKPELGVYYLALSLLVFARGVQEQIVTVPYTVHRNHRSTADASRFAGSTLAHQLLFGSTISLLLVAYFFAHRGDGGFGAMALLLAGVAPLYLLREYLRQMSFAHLHVVGALAADVLIAIVQLGILLPLALSGSLTVETAWRVIALVYGISGLLWFATKRISFEWRLAAIAADWHSNWSFGKWAVATQLLACSSPYLIPWMVAWTRSEEETGLFAACSTMVGLSHMFLQGISNFQMPRAALAFVRGGRSELVAVLKKTTILFLMTLVPVCVLGFAAGEWIVEIVYGPDFADSGWIVGLLALSVLANGISLTAGNGLCAMERPAANLRAGLVAVCVSIGTMLTLVPLLGPLGAALSTLATIATDAAIRSWTLRRMLREL